MIQTNTLNNLDKYNIQNILPHLMNWDAVAKRAPIRADSEKKEEWKRRIQVFGNTGSFDADWRKYDNWEGRNPDHFMKENVIFGIAEIQIN